MRLDGSEIKAENRDPETGSKKGCGSGERVARSSLALGSELVRESCRPCGNSLTKFSERFGFPGHGSIENDFRSIGEVAHKISPEPLRLSFHTVCLINDLSPPTRTSTGIHRLTIPTQRTNKIRVMFLTSPSTNARTNAQLHPGPTYGSPTQLVS
jgi:hypothetical protein